MYNRYLDALERYLERRRDARYRNLLVERSRERARLNGRHARAA